LGRTRRTLSAHGDERVARCGVKGRRRKGKRRKQGSKIESYGYRNCGAG